MFTLNLILARIRYKLELKFSYLLGLLSSHFLNYVRRRNLDFFFLPNRTKRLPTNWRHTWGDGDL